MIKSLVQFVVTAIIFAGGLAYAQENDAPPNSEEQPIVSEEDTYSDSEVSHAVADFFGVSAEAAGSAVERIFADKGRPVGYIYGGEASAAFVVGLRYGKGTMVLKDGTQRTVYWQGPSVGFDVGGNGSKSFTLIYGLTDPEQIFQRFAGIDGSAYLVAGIGVNYQGGHGIGLAPMRTGVGLRLGANVGYLKYGRRRKILPF